MAVAASHGISVIETLIVARLGPDALAGVTLALALYSLIFVACLGVVVAITPILSQAVGRGDAAAVRSLAHQAGFVTATVSAVGLLVFAMSPLLLAPLANSQAELDTALAYLTGAAAGLPAWVGYIGLRSVLMTLGSVRIATWTMLASVPVHALMAWALVHGTPWTPGAGVLGAGVAHCLVSCLTVVVIVMAMRRFGTSAVAQAARGPVRFNAAEYRAIIRLGLPMSARILLREGMLPASVVLVAPAGAAMVAAHAVAMRVVGLAGIVAFGIANATIVRVGEAIGASDWPQARAVTALATRLSLGLGGVICVAIVIGAPQIVGLFLPADEPMAPMAARLLMVACVFLLIDCVQGPVGAALVAMQDARMPLAIYAVCIWLLGFPLAYVCAGVLPVAAEGVWAGLSAGSALATALIIARLRRKLKSHTFAAAVGSSRDNHAVNTDQ
jgi:MATE family multidrug resistance protein